MIGHYNLELLKAIYGLVDGPIMLQLALLHYLTQHCGLYKSVHDNNFLKLTEGWKIVLIVLVHVDDLLVFATPDYMRWIHSTLEERFGTMKQLLPPLIFCGISHGNLADGHLFCHQLQYLEKLKPIVLEKHRVKQEQSNLKPKEHFDFRSNVCSL